MRRRITRHVAVARGVGVVDECGHDGLDGAVLDELLDQHVDAIDVGLSGSVIQEAGKRSKSGGSAASRRRSSDEIKYPMVRWTGATKARYQTGLFASRAIARRSTLRDSSQDCTTTLPSLVFLRNATPSVFHQRHIGRVLRSSCNSGGRRFTSSRGGKPRTGRCSPLWPGDLRNDGGGVSAAGADGSEA